MKTPFPSKSTCMNRLSRYCLAFFLMASSCKPTGGGPSFVTVEGTRMMRDGKPYAFMGTNYWQGMNLGSTGEGGDRDRLRRELDQMQSIGITNLRILAVSEGPDGSPYRVLPALQDRPGELKEELLQGLDFLLDEMGKRGMTAVLVLNNFWPWSGGMAQYRLWNGADSIPYPPPHPNGDWDAYQRYAAGFYADSVSISRYHEVIRNLVNRRNSISGMNYHGDPTIMSWQLCNEPRGIDRADLMNRWIDETAALIKSMDRNHLVSTGAEGYTSSPTYSGTDFLKMHDGKDIDYATAHIWIQNWGWYDPKRHDSTYGSARDSMLSYLQRHVEDARRLGKPLVLEEFGIMRDKGDFDPLSSTVNRDGYYKEVFSAVLESVGKGAMSGVNFWAWAGEGRPKEPGALWRKGDALTGDPPHEPQGWYSVYSRDSSTHRVVGEYSRRIREQAGAR
jgi:mannan endo-1,4-beta-mannosidase